MLFSAVLVARRVLTTFTLQQLSINKKLMKTQGTSFVFARLAGLFLSAALFLTACNNSAPASDVDIHTAVITDDIEAVKQYIADGGDLNVKDPFGGSSPLISATVFGKTEAARLLLDAGADINFQNSDGSTALHTAAFFCRPEIVKLLLEKNADQTIKNKYGATPLDNVSAPFADMKEAYDMMGKALGPMGLQLDYAYIEQTRPVIAEMLN